MSLPDPIWGIGQFRNDPSSLKAFPDFSNLPQCIDASRRPVRFSSMPVCDTLPGRLEFVVAHD